MTTKAKTIRRAAASKPAAIDTTYNGWKNYETWNVKLWIDNDSGSYEYWRDTTKAVLIAAQADKTFTKREMARLSLMRQLEEAIKGEAPDLGASTYADLLAGALAEVSWYEIAESLINDAEED